jgi:hypothetical protein
MPKICRKWKNPLQALKNLLRVQQISAWNGRTHSKNLRTCYEYNSSRHGMEEPTTSHSKNGRTHHGSEEPNRTTEDPTKELKNPP